MKAGWQCVLLAVLVGASLTGLVACGDNNKTLENPVVTVDQAKRSREIYEKASGDWNAVSAADKAEMVKFYGDEEKAKAIWATMSQPRAVPDSAGGRNELPSGMPPEATTGR